jgi:hypothetical protein
MTLDKTGIAPRSGSHPRQLRKTWTVGSAAFLGLRVSRSRGIRGTLPACCALDTGRLSELGKRDDQHCEGEQREAEYAAWEP